MGAVVTWYKNILLHNYLGEKLKFCVTNKLHRFFKKFLLVLKHCIYVPEALKNTKKIKITNCSRLNVCVPLKFMLKCNLQCDVIWRWGLWGVVRPWRWSLMNGINALIKEALRELRHPFQHMRTQWKDGCLWTWKHFLTWHWTCQHPDLEFHSL